MYISNSNLASWPSQFWHSQAHFVCYMFLAPKQQMWSVDCFLSIPLLEGLSQDSFALLPHYTHIDMLILVVSFSREGNTGYIPWAYYTFAECYFGKDNHLVKRTYIAKGIVQWSCYTTSTTSLIKMISNGILFYFLQKPANILVMGEGPERGRVKIGKMD